MGKLNKIWLSVPKDVPVAELPDAFSSHFGAKWGEVLNTSETSLAYNAFNDTYFAVSDLRPVENLTLDRLLGKSGINKPPNVIVS